jgi:hypothetical protein
VLQPLVPPALFTMQRAHELASGAKPAGTDYLPYTPLRAKRGVSTPLMVGAAAGSGRQQLSLAMEPVPPVQVSLTFQER